MWLGIVCVDGVDWIDVTPDNIQWTRGVMITKLAGLPLTDSTSTFLNERGS